jgi:hypothetical protein
MIFFLDYPVRVCYAQIAILALVDAKYILRHYTANWNHTKFSSGKNYQRFYGTDIVGDTGFNETVILSLIEYSCI